MAVLHDWDAFTARHCREFAEEYFGAYYEDEDLFVEDFVQYAHRTIQERAMPYDGSWRTLVHRYERELGEFPPPSPRQPSLLDEFREAESLLDRMS